MTYDSTHSFDILVKASEGKQETKKIVSGKGNKLCFEQKG
jgi:hypothetical protein